MGIGLMCYLLRRGPPYISQKGLPAGAVKEKVVCQRQGALSVGGDNDSREKHNDEDTEEEEDADGEAQAESPAEVTRLLGIGRGPRLRNNQRLPRGKLFGVCEAEWGGWR